MGCGKSQVTFRNFISTIYICIHAKLTRKQKLLPKNQLSLASSEYYYFIFCKAHSFSSKMKGHLLNQDIVVGHSYTCKCGHLINSWMEIGNHSYTHWLLCHSIIQSLFATAYVSESFESQVLRHWLGWFGASR